MKKIDHEIRGILDVANVTIWNNVDEKEGNIPRKGKLLIKSWGHLTLKKLNHNQWLSKLHWHAQIC
jgi:hypothetical protein